jgi:hypothetical protein
MPVIPALRRLRQEFKASLGYIVRLCLQQKEGKKTNIQSNSILN